MTSEFITGIIIYSVISCMIGAGISRYEQLVNGQPNPRLISIFLYPIMWPYIAGLAISKLLYFTYTHDESENESGDEDIKNDE